MILFEITLGNTISGAEQLFIKNAAYSAAGGSVYVNGTASFETYFNLLPHDTYREYCGVNKAVLNLRAKGRYRADVYWRKKNGARVPVASLDCEGDASVPFAFPKAGGYTFFEIESAGGCKIYGGDWSCEGEEKRYPRIAIIICTYRRESFVERNLAMLREALSREPEWAARLHVFVVDNAGTLPAGKGFYDVIKNRNLGGSGGFARGMYEADRAGGFTHMLLTDDDIRLDFSVIKRTWRLLAALEREHAGASVGGAMLVLEEPTVQYEFGGRFDGLMFRSINGGLDMRETASLLKNAHAPEPNYNAWWYCCMPASCVPEHGLPMPFFIKGDDVEYGLRAAERFILSSGIAVWHSDFKNKYNGTLEYYIKRNGAVVAALRSRSGALKAAIRFAYFIFKNLTLKNYDCAELICAAYRDFTGGYKFFTSADPARLNERLRAGAPSPLPEDEICKLCGGPPRLKQPKSQKRHSLAACFLMFLENYLPAFAFSDKAGVTDAGFPRASDCFLKRTVVHLERESGRGYVFRLDTKRRRRLRREAYKVFFGMLFCYRKLRKDYRENEQKMYSAENWRRMFFIEK